MVKTFLDFVGQHPVVGFMVMAFLASVICLPFQAAVIIVKNICKTVSDLRNTEDE
jgi:hypothetical protein